MRSARRRRRRGIFSRLAFAAFLVAAIEMTVKIHASHPLEHTDMPQPMNAGTPINRVKLAQQQARPAYGTYVQGDGADSVEIAAMGGLDFVILDGQHGLSGFDATIAQLRAADASSITPIVRVGSADPTLAMRYLDAGAMGILVPDIGTRAQAEVMAQAVRYATPSTKGRRGACATARAALRTGLDWGSFVQWSNENVLLWLLIESQQGLRNFDEIVTVPGVDAYLVGAFDLGHEMGVIDDPTDRTVDDLLLDVARRSKSRGVPVVRNVRWNNADGLDLEVRKWVDAGAYALTVGADRRLLRDLYASKLTAIQGVLTS